MGLRLKVGLECFIHVHECFRQNLREAQPGSHIYLDQCQGGGPCEDPLGVSTRASTHYQKILILRTA